MSKREIAHLLGYGNPSGFDLDILQRFRDATSLRDIANGLYQYANLHDETDKQELAEAALSVYTDRLPRDPAAFDGAPPDKAFRGPGTPPRAFEPRDLVDIGQMLRVAAAIDPIQALRLAQHINLSKFVAYAKTESNLGRLAVFISGLHDASRGMCREFVMRIGEIGFWEDKFQENERIANLVLLARVIGRVSRVRAGEFVRLLIEKFEGEIKDHIKYEANLMEVSNWLRMLRVAGSDVVRNHLATLTPALREAEEYDSDLRHLLEASEAMIECEQPEAADRYAQMALKQSRQIQTIHSLHHLVVILQKAQRVEQQIGFPGYTARLFESLDESHFSLMITRAIMASSACHPVIVAFSYFLFKSIQDGGFETLTYAIGSIRTLTLERASREKRTVYRTLMQVLCSAPLEPIVESAESSGWKMLWERGLVHVLFRALYSGIDSPFAKVVESDCERWPPASPFEFSEHAGNVKYGLCYQLTASIDVSPDFMDGLRAEVSNRAEDEVFATKGLLQEDQLGRRILPVYYVWSFLRETVLKANYFPWETEITYSARRTAFNEDVQRNLEAITA